VPSSLTARARAAASDAVLTSEATIDLARAAAGEEAGGAQLVGAHEGAEPDGERLLTHYFGALAAGYRGWRWAVTVARVPRGRVATVCEVVLIPGPGALLPPAWLPWSERLRPGDLGVGDLLPTAADDVRLEPGYAATGDDDADQLAVWELGLGRARVLSTAGREVAADRWYAGDCGPDSPIAAAAPAPCASCGFLMPMAGSLRTAFGVCANEFSPYDGRVVSLDHGCGAHSEAVVIPPLHAPEPPVLDEVQVEVVRTHPDPGHGSVIATDPGEDLGHG
jgi:hypothetical protein